MNQSLKASQWLRRFRVDVTSSSNRVFGNGRQQVEVTVTLEPRDGQAITAEQLDSVRLLVCTDEGEYLALEAQVDQGSAPLLASPARDPRFNYFAATASAPSALMDSSAKTLRRRFYVSSTFPGGTPTTLYAGIFQDEEVHFETNASPFSSSVVIETLTPPKLAESAFLLEMEPRITRWVDGAASTRDDEYQYDVGYFSTRDPNNPLIMSKAEQTPSGVPFYERNSWDHVLISFELINDYSQCCELTVHGLGDPFEQDLPGAVVKLNQRAHQLCLMRYFNRFYSRQNSNEVSSRPSLWRLVDINGNEHLIEFFTSDDGDSIRFRCRSEA